LIGKLVFGRKLIYGVYQRDLIPFFCRSNAKKGQHHGLIVRNGHRELPPWHLCLADNVGLPQIANSSGFGFRKLEHFGLNGFQNGIPKIGTGIQNLYADKLALLVELRSYVWTDFDTADFRIVGDRKMEDVLFLKICHSSLIHYEISRT